MLLYSRNALNLLDEASCLQQFNQLCNMLLCVNQYILIPIVITGAYKSGILRIGQYDTEITNMLLVFCCIVLIQSQYHIFI